MSLIFNWKIKSIKLYPFGGYTIFDVSINKPFLEEILVFSGGILFQLIFFSICSLIIDHNTYTYKIFETYNLTILIFNMIPIIPLDGSKILNILFNYVFPFKKAHLLSIYTSYLLLFILIIYNFNNLNMILIILLLLFILIKEHKNHIYIFNAFLLERYLNKFMYNKIKFVNSPNLKKIMKYFKTIFINENKYYDEYEILKNKYKNS